jgi:hypothetical protein
MSIANLLVPNDYLLYVNSNASNETMFKCTMVGDQTASNNATILLGATSTGGSGFLEEWNLGGFILDNALGTVTVPKAGKYLIIVKVTYQNGSVANTASVDDFKLVDASANIIVESNINYVNAVGNATMQRNFSNIVQLNAGTVCHISATVGGSGIGSNVYKGNASFELTTLSMQYITA